MMRCKSVVLLALLAAFPLAGVYAQSGQLQPIPDVELSELPAAERDVIEMTRENFDQRVEVTEEDDALAALYAHLANVYYANGFIEPARAAYRNATVLMPEHPEPRYMLAMSEYRLGNLDEAIRQYDLVIETEPNHIPSMIRRARIYLERGDMINASRGFEAAVDLVPDSVAAHAGLAWIAAYAGEHREVVEHLERALEIDPSATRLHTVLASAYRALGEEALASEHEAQQGDGVERMFDPVLDRVMLQSLDAERLAALGASRMEQGYPNAAETLFARASELEPDNEDYALQYGEALYLLGIQLVAQNDCAAAGDRLSRTLDLDVVYAPAYLALARLRATCLDAGGDALEEALEWAEGLYQQSPGLDTAETLAMVYAAHGRFDDAVDLQAQAIFEAHKQQILGNRPNLHTNMEQYQASRRAAVPFALPSSTDR